MNFSLSLMFNFSITDWVIIAALLLFFIIQFLFYFLLYKKPYCYLLKKEDVSVPDDDLPPVSVIIASKNESENLEKHLPAILNQDYPDFEVIVVNMGSTDETDMVLKRLEQTYDNLYHTYIPQEAEEWNEKKLALTLGIKAAKNNVLLFTEPYCEPISDQWIKEFAKEFVNGKEIVLGFCIFNIPKNVFMRRFILYDNLMQGIKYLSMAIVRRPFMGTGMNMAYTRDLFFKQKGFSSILNFEDGEDDLYVNKIANGKNTGVVISPESMTRSDVVTSFSVWRALKSKYLHTKQFYQNFHPSIFGLETLSKYGFYLSFICAVGWGIFNANYILLAIAIVLFVIRYCFQLIIINRNSNLFGGDKFYADLIFLDIFQPINNFRFKKYANKKRNKFR